MFEISVEPLGRLIHGSGSQPLSVIAADAGLGARATCGGRGVCGHCAVRVIRGEVTPPSESEVKTIGREKIRSGWRLACQIFFRSDAAVYIPPDSVETNHHPFIKGMGSWNNCDASGVVPDVSRTGKNPAGVGVAVDLGTTHIAACLADLQTGKILDAAGAVNPQTAYGDDVMARIHHAIKSEDGAGQLRDAAAKGINSLICDLCRRTGIPTRNIVNAVIAGNTAMHHLLAGLPVRSLGLAPYIPAEKNSLEIPARELGLDISPGASVYFPPNIGGFVGGDHVAMLMGSDIPEKKGTVLALDIGTNTEISLIVHGRHLTCSAASGPAFEGAHIRFGMRASSGAIEKIVIHAETVEYQTIDNTSPKGLCGSGILDLAAQMLKAGIMDRKGAITGTHPNCRRGMNAEPEFIVIPAHLNNGLDITFSRSDINEIQLAKAAVKTGISILLRRAGISEDDIDEVVIAGAFGHYLNIQSGMDIGMFPRLDIKKYTQVGNAAGTGSVILLVSPEKRVKAVHLARNAVHVDLASEKNFNSIFARSLMFD